MKRHVILAAALVTLVLPAGSQAAPAQSKIMKTKAGQLKTVRFATPLRAYGTPAALSDWAQAHGLTVSQVSKLLAVRAPDHTIEYIHWKDGTTERVDLGSQTLPTGDAARHAFGEQVLNARGRAESWRHDQVLTHSTRRLSAAARYATEIDDWCVVHLNLTTEPYDDTYGLIYGSGEMFCTNTNYITISGELIVDWQAVDAGSGDGETYTYITNDPLVGGCYLANFVNAGVLADVTIWWDGGGPEEATDGVAEYGCGYWT